MYVGEYWAGLKYLAVPTWLNGVVTTLNGVVTTLNGVVTTLSS